MVEKDTLDAVLDMVKTRGPQMIGRPGDDVAYMVMTLSQFDEALESHQDPQDNTPPEVEEFFVEGEWNPDKELLTRGEMEWYQEEHPHLEDDFPIELEYNDQPGVNSPVDHYPYAESDFLYDCYRERGGF